MNIIVYLSSAYTEIMLTIFIFMKMKGIIKLVVSYFFLLRKPMKWELCPTFTFIIRMHPDAYLLIVNREFVVDDKHVTKLLVVLKF